MSDKKIRSPLFYTGDKYKIISSIKEYFPSEIEKFVEPFVGGGSVFLNVEAKEFFENDIDKNIISLHEYFCTYTDPQKLIKKLLKKIADYGFSCSYLDNGDSVPDELKQQFIKTYYAKFNAEPYKRLKDKYNSARIKNIDDLYLLLIYGFNRMIRFNRAGQFNLPVGNVDFNQNAVDSLTNYVDLVNKKNMHWSNTDYVSFLNSIEITTKDFIYVDPPYLITSSEYNKLWNQDDDDMLCFILDQYSAKGIHFAMSNVVNYKGKENTKLIEWATKYRVIPIKSNYINYHDNSVKSFGEVLITNYGN